MLKNISILGLIVLLIISIMSGCISTGYSNEESSAIEERTATTPVPTTTPVDKAAISARLARLTKEDGRGTIDLEMSINEIILELDKISVPYSKIDDGAVLVEDGTLYRVGGGRYFSVSQTYSGLKLGDSLTKVIELYGQPDEKIDGDNCYIYNSGRKIYQDQVILQIQMSGERVNTIFIKVDEKVYGGAE